MLKVVSIPDTIQSSRNDDLVAQVYGLVQCKKMFIH